MSRQKIAPPDNGEATPLLIEPESDDAIHVGAGGKLTVPRECVDDDFDEGEQLDLVGGQPKGIRKPHRHEWIALKIDSSLPTLLLLHKPKADDIDEEYYYVDQALRGPIRDELKAVRVFVYYSFKTKRHHLWVVKVTPGNSWYESLNQLFMQPPEFFATKAIRVASDRNNSRYNVRSKDRTSEAAWPEEATGELLGEALGDDRFIRSREHPLYRDLTEGEEV